MRLYTLFALLLIGMLVLGCGGETAPEEIADEEMEESEQEEAVTPTEEVPEENDEDVPEPEPEQTPEVEEPELTYAQESLNHVKDEIDHYAFTFESAAYGTMIVWVDATSRKYLLQDFLAEVVDGELVPTTYRPDSVTHIEKAREGRADLIDYVWVEKEEGTQHACFIDSEEGEGRCILSDPDDDIDEDEALRHLIIYDDVRFSEEPMLPTTWLLQFRDLNPIEIRKGRIYKDLVGNTQFPTDQLYYDNGDGTETLVYVHTVHKMPVKVEILKDRKVTKTYLYSSFTPNFPYANSWYPEFLTE